MKAVVILGYVFILLGSLGMIMYQIRFGLASNITDHQYSPTRFLRMNGAQIWAASWIFIILGTSIHLLDYWAAEVAGRTSKTEPLLVSVERPADIQVVDVWQRMRQCSEQAERVVESDRADGAQVLSWTSHYNSTYERCYTQIHHRNGPGFEKPELKLPLQLFYLVDAFENKTLSSCTTWLLPSAENYCSIAGDDSAIGNCAACRAFIKERMSG